MEAQETTGKILIIEPYYGGSHRRLIDLIVSKLASNAFTLITMSPKKWHWRARTSALYISTIIPKNHNFDVLFCTSVLPLAELLGLRPDLAKLHKTLYFHENQLEFPVRVTKERDFQYGYNEILSCLAADKVLFNSKYNMESFLSNIHCHMKLQPDYRIKGLKEEIMEKCTVIFYPLDLQSIDNYISNCENRTDSILHIIWPHRWEFDKNPEAFYRVLCRLVENGAVFKVSILGESSKKIPAIFREISVRLQSRLVHCGFVESLQEYYKILKDADVVVSTAIHEFFGVSVLEAVYCGCIPVVPKRLAYKELYEGEVQEMYHTEDELYEVLTSLCKQKQQGTLKQNYKHVALPYNSNRWFENLSQIMFESHT